MLKRIPIDILVKTPLKHVMRTLAEGVIPVFMLHRIEDRERGVSGIPPKTIDDFLSQLKRNGYSFMGMPEFIDVMNKPHIGANKKAIFTMDDGYLDQVEKGVPVFQAHDCPVSIAVITDFISGKMWPWDEKIRYMFEISKSKKINFSLGSGETIGYEMENQHARFKVMREIRSNLKKQPEEIILQSVNELALLLDVEIPKNPPENCKPFGWNEVKKLEGDGVNFIPHTRTHIILSNLIPQRAKEEIEGSISDVKKHIEPVPAFIYPNGRHRDYNDDHIKVLQSNGIKAAFSTDHAYLHLHEFERSSNERFNLPRIAFPEGLDQDKILSHLDCVRERYLRNTFHALFETAYGTRRQAFSVFLEKLNKNSYYKKYKNLDVKKIKRIIFVCKGNICGSPFAEVVAKAENSNLPVVSMGYDTSGGDKAEPRAIKIAKEFGYNMESVCSTRLEKGMLCNGDLIIVMEVPYLKKLNRLTSDVDCQITLLGLWDDVPILSIKNPCGRSESRFRKIFAYIHRSVQNIMNEIECNKKKELNST